MKRICKRDLDLHISDVSSFNDETNARNTDLGKTYCCDTLKDTQCKTQPYNGTCQTCEGIKCKTATCVCASLHNCATIKEDVCKTKSLAAICCAETVQGEECGTSKLIECPSVQVCEVSFDTTCAVETTFCGTDETICVCGAPME